MKVYIAGPISAEIGVSKEEKLRRFADAAEYLMANGYETTNPLEVEVECGLEPEACAVVSRHISQGTGQHGSKSHAWECYMKADLRAMLLCTHIALLPLAHMSPGARLEYQIAQKVGMKVIQFDIRPDGTLFDVNEGK